MPESVRVDMRKIMTAGEVIKPTGDAVRVHMFSVVLSEHIPCIVPSITICYLQPELLPSVLSQKAHCFGWQGKISCVACFRSAFIYPPTGGHDYKARSIFIRLLSKSTFSHFSPMISPLRHPVTSSSWVISCHLRGSVSSAFSISEIVSGWK